MSTSTLHDEAIVIEIDGDHHRDARNEAEYSQQQKDLDRAPPDLVGIKKDIPEALLRLLRRCGRHENGGDRRGDAQHAP